MSEQGAVGRSSGGLEHAVFRIADAQAEQAKATNRLVDELAKWRELLTQYIQHNPEH